MTMPSPLPPETTPEWTEQDERELQRNAALSDPWCLDQSMVFFIRRYAREIRRLRSEREAQDAEIAKLLSKYDQQRIDGVALYNDLLAIGVDRPGCSPNVRSELSRSRSVPETALNGELLPCPFCGGSPAEIDPSPSIHKGQWVVECVDCGADIRLDAESYSAAVEAWNHRASVPNTGTALSEEERQRVMEIRARLIAASTWGYQWGVQQQAQADLTFSLAIIDRLSSAPSRGSEQ